MRRTVSRLSVARCVWLLVFGQCLGSKLRSVPQILYFNSAKKDSGSIPFTYGQTVFNVVRKGVYSRKKVTMALAGLTQMLPASIIELNMKVATDSQQSAMAKRQIVTDFDDIPVEPRKLKREVSLPGDVKNWNLDNFDAYLNDEDLYPNEFGDGIVPACEQVRCVSLSSVSFHDDIRPVRSCNVKTISTVRMDSGSTCISSDYSYGSAKQKCEEWLDPEETYQNLNLFLQEVPEVNTDTLSSVSSLPSSSSCDGTMEYSTLQNYGSPLSSTSFDNFTEKITNSIGIKRRLDSVSEDEVFIAKQTKQESSVVEDCRYVESRKKNNIASKNCRKTRKQKEREMEQQLNELEREKETLTVKVQVLEELIQAHKTCLLNAIVQRR